MWHSLNDLMCKPPFCTRVRAEGRRTKWPKGRIMAAVCWACLFDTGRVPSNTCKQERSKAAAPKARSILDAARTSLLRKATCFEHAGRHAFPHNCINSMQLGRRPKACKLCESLRVTNASPTVGQCAGVPMYDSIAKKAPSGRTHRTPLVTVTTQLVWQVAPDYKNDTSPCGWYAINATRATRVHGRASFGLSMFNPSESPGRP